MVSIMQFNISNSRVQIYKRGRPVHDRMLVGFTTTYAISAYHN